MKMLVMVALLQAGAPPPLQDRFPGDPPGHVLLIEELGSGETIRREGLPPREAPLGEASRWLLAIAGMELGVLDPDRRVPCDSTCWARGSHGEAALAEVLAYGCETGAAAIRGPGLAARAAALAREAGFETAGADPAAWTAKPEDWTRLWRRLALGSQPWKPGTQATVMAAAGLSVSGPRGSARPLHDPTRRTLAMAASGKAGTWVCGTSSYRDDRWVFALFVREGSAALATARAHQLLDETFRVATAAARP